MLIFDEGVFIFFHVLQPKYVHVVFAFNRFESA